MVRNLKSKLKSRSGFSLVELIVVIAIMVILVAMLLPSVAGLINSATGANAAQTAASLYTAATTACTANAAIPSLDKNGRLNNLNGTNTSAGNLAVKNNIDANAGELAKMNVCVDKEAMNVLYVYYKSSDGKNYINPTRYATDASDTTISDSDKAKGIISDTSITAIKTALGTNNYNEFVLGTGSSTGGTQGTTGGTQGTT